MREKGSERCEQPKMAAFTENGAVELENACWQQIEVGMFMDKCYIAKSDRKRLKLNLND